MNECLLFFLFHTKKKNSSRFKLMSCHVMFFFFFSLKMKNKNKNPSSCLSIKLQVNYSFDGCENFDPDNSNAKNGGGDGSKTDKDSEPDSPSPLSALTGGKDKSSCPPDKWNSVCPEALLFYLSDVCMRCRPAY